MKLNLIISIFLAASFLMGCGTTKNAGSSAIKKTKRGYTISLSNQVLEIDAMSGAKVGSLTLDGVNFLTDSLVYKEYWGSSFWISPESVWDWSFADFDKTINRLVNKVKDKNIRLSAVLKGVSGLSFGKF